MQGNSHSRWHTIATIIIIITINYFLNLLKCFHNSNIEDFGHWSYERETQSCCRWSKQSYATVRPTALLHIVIYRVSGVTFCFCLWPSRNPHGVFLWNSAYRCCGGRFSFIKKRKQEIECKTLRPLVSRWSCECNHTPARKWKYSSHRDVPSPFVADTVFFRF